METLWPGSSAQAAANNLYRALHFARKAFGPSPTPRGYIRLRNEQLALCPDGRLWVDADAFEDAAAVARRSRDPAAYRAAIELYAGDLLPEDRYEDWAEDRRRELKRTYLTLLEELADMLEERDEYESAIEILTRIVSEEPIREEVHVGLMRLYALTGRKDEALEQYRRFSEVLRRELGALPGAESRHLREEIASGRLSSPAVPKEDRLPHLRAPHLHNLPLVRSSFVGREREMREIERLLSMTGLLTLAGPGGSGKTRLALQVARKRVALYPDGVWLADLAPLSEPALVPRAVATVFGVREQPDRPLTDTLADALRRKRSLLILDNCEHLVDAAARLADRLLGSCPGLQVFATSREPLGVAGEAIWRVYPLSVPEAGEPPEDLMRSEAVRLFVERARSRSPTFALAERNSRVVAEVCRTLEGIPLAIELATARMAALAVEQVAERLEDSLGLLTAGDRTAAPRHRTLRGTLEWSYELLSEPERKLFGRLSEFAGGFTLEAAEAVGAGESIDQGEVFDVLSLLVEKSLVVAEAVETSHAASVRYRLLEPIRQYAREKLEASGEAETVRARHARYCLALAEEVKPHLYGPEQIGWLDRLEAEHDNMRVALAWTEQAGEVETGLRLGEALFIFWLERGYIAEGRDWLERPLAKSADVPAAVLASALVAAGGLAVAHGGYERPNALAGASLSLWQELGNKAGMVRALHVRGASALYAGKPAEAASFFEQALTLYPESRDPWQALNKSDLGVAVYELGDRDRGIALCEEALAIQRELGEGWTTAITLTYLGRMMQERGDHARATELYKESLALFWEHRDRWGMTEAISGVASVAAECGWFARSIKLYGAVEVLRESTGIPFWPRDRAVFERLGALARHALGEVGYSVAWAEGQAMSLEQTVEYTLSEEPQPLAPREPPNSLSPREKEVALLVSQGLTNRQVAEELRLSRRTVDTHVGRILRKLGLRSRAQLSDWSHEP